MRLGIFGGSFDPVHYGHLLLAECCREQLRLDEVWFLPAAIPPHKQSRELAPAAARVEMLELAAAGHAAFRVCRYEIDRGGVNYTADTLAHLKNEDPTRELFFLMGADSLHDLATWKDPARLCELATPIAVGRGDVKPDARDLDWSGLGGLVPPERLAAMHDLVVQMPRIELSSSDIRRRVAQGLSIRYRTPRAVEKYIETHGLYRAVGGQQPTGA
jgi:nicotinate-nucleotide adenylyltransferase